MSNLERKRWLAEEIYLRKALGQQLLNDNNLEQLKKSNATENYQLSCDPPSYNILQNALYQQLMFYTPGYDSQTPEHRESSNLILASLLICRHEDEWWNLGKSLKNIYTTVSQD